MASSAHPHRFSWSPRPQGLGALAVLVAVGFLLLPAAAHGREVDRALATCAKVDAPQLPHAVVPEVRGLRCAEAAALVRRARNTARGPRLAGWSCRTRDRTDYSQPRAGNRMHTRCTRDNRMLAWAWSVWV